MRLDVNDERSRVHVVRERILGRDTEEIPQVTPFDNRSLPARLSIVRVACILDELSYEVFRHDCILVQLTPENWQNELETLQPHLLFVESAWQGAGGAWQGKIPTIHSNLIGVLDWCKRKKVPTAFWNKEDPIDFDLFLGAALQFDHIFTTDIDCIAKYKLLKNPENVHLLTFAMQPKSHNPIELFSRKTSACFAGSYYAKFKERNEDFQRIFDSLVKISGVDIYDRNYHQQVKQHKFPERFHKNILGTLHASQISQAYKGYKFGININTIKDSQTMFARRVFELMASNTPVVSNLSRGMRVLLGDLTICSDNDKQIEEQVECLANDDLHYRKFRLAGLRKVMLEHSSASRLADIIRFTHGKDISQAFAFVTCIAQAKNEKELERVLETYQNQDYPRKRLFVVLKNGNVDRNSLPGGVTILSELEAKKRFPPSSSKDGWLAFLSPHDYYGPNYLKDTMMATLYTGVKAIGKASYYYKDGYEYVLSRDVFRYTFIDHLNLRSSCVDQSLFIKHNIWDLSCLVDGGKVSGLLCFSIDEFNYCRNCQQSHCPIVDDEVIGDKGISMEKLAQLSDQVDSKAAEGAIIQLDPESLLKNLSKFSKRVGLTLRNGRIHITSTLEGDAYEYAYLKEDIPVPDLNLPSEFRCMLYASRSLEIKIVMIFLDKDGQRLSSQFVESVKKAVLKVPPDAKTLRVGLRVAGRGEADLVGLTLSSARAAHSSHISNAQNLVVTSSFDPVGNLFDREVYLAQRLLRRSGANSEVLVLSDSANDRWKEVEGTLCLKGDQTQLDLAIETGPYTRIDLYWLNPETIKTLSRTEIRRTVRIWPEWIDAGLHLDMLESMAGNENITLSFWFYSPISAKSFLELAGGRVGEGSIHVVSPLMDLRKRGESIHSVRDGNVLLIGRDDPETGRTMEEIRNRLSHQPLTVFTLSQPSTTSTSSVFIVRSDPSRSTFMHRSLKRCPRVVFWSILVQTLTRSS